MALQIVFITFTSMLAGFEFEPAKDDMGNDIPVTLTPSPGIIS